MASSRPTKSQIPVTTSLAGGPVKARARRSGGAGAAIRGEDLPLAPPAVFQKIVEGIARQHCRPAPTSSREIFLVPYTSAPHKITSAEVKHRVPWHFTASINDKKLQAALKAFYTAVNGTQGLKVIPQRSIGKNKAPRTIIGCVTENVDAVVEVLEKHRATSGLAAFVTEVRPRVWFTLRSQHASWVVSVQVDSGEEAAFINEVSKVLFDAGEPDPQIAVQKRNSADAGGLEGVQGVIVDVDHNKPADIDGAIRAAGLPTPAVRWETTNGYKLLFTFSMPVGAKPAVLFAKWVTIAIPGGDKNSWLLSQFQHLPICHKIKNDKPLEIDFPAVQMNATPLDLDTFDFARLPPRVIGLGHGRRVAITAEERERVEKFLLDRKTPSPEVSGQRRYAQCPNDTRHSHDSDFVVYRASDGIISAHCFGGHDHGMRSDWSERDLLALADAGAPGADAKSGTTGVDVLRDLPTTWVGVEYLRQLVVDGFGGDGQIKEIVDAVEELWYLAKAHQLQPRLFERAIKEAENAGASNLPFLQPPTIAEIVEFFESKRAPYLSRSSPRTFFDGVNLDLYYFNATDAAFPINTNSTTLSAKAPQFVLFWRGSEGRQLEPKIEYKTKKHVVSITSLEYRPENQVLYEAHWNTALSGDGEALAALGLPTIINDDFPACFTDDRYHSEPKTKCITQHRLPEIKEGDDDFDVVGFFEGLFDNKRPPPATKDNKRLPLATKEDVRRLVMAIASPFLRHIAPGLLGVYWLLGPSGAGKDFLASLVCDIWLEGVVHKATKSSFDLRDVDDTELQKTLFAAKTAVYARAKEAGKTQAKILRLIQLAGTEKITKRGHYKHEIQVPNTYVFMADSAEDLPDKKEIARRTVAINVEAVDPSVSLGEVRAEVLARAPDILRGLKRLIETQDAEWYLNQAETDTRPVVPVALARLFDVKLDNVGGRDLSQIFAAMLEYLREDGVQDLGHRELQRLQRAGHKGTVIETAVPSYSYAHFVETMSQDKEEDDGGKRRRVPRGYKMLLREFDTHRKLRRTLDTEMGYKLVGRNRKFLPITLNGEPYAFRFVGSDNQNFVLMPEWTLCKAAEIEPATPGLAVYIEKRTELENQLADVLRAIEEERAREVAAISGELVPEDTSRYQRQLDAITNRYLAKETDATAEYRRRILDLPLGTP